MSAQLQQAQVLAGLDLLAAHCAALDPDAPTARERLDDALGPELARKLVEIDARPSDCLALATAQKRPIFVTNSLFEQVEDMSEVLERINENGTEAE